VPANDFDPVPMRSRGSGDGAPHRARLPPRPERIRGALPGGRRSEV